mmetsp:Transcript_15235/g.28673  ORF Transcript_15235/g.28673 Transcript_15235/m.28673 type:complete len:667 (+) Transcript_15235:146-2146(+)
MFNISSRADNQHQISWKRAVLLLNRRTITAIFLLCCLSPNFTTIASAFCSPAVAALTHQPCDKNNIMAYRLITRTPMLVSYMRIPAFQSAPTHLTRSHLRECHNYLLCEPRMNPKLLRRYFRPNSIRFNATPGTEASDCDSETVLFADKFLATIHSTTSNEIIPKVLSSWNRSSEAPLVILLCVSGGCDSVALLHSMMHLLNSKDTHPQGYQLCREDGTCMPCAVHVVHFDHQQRGGESDEDRLLVEKMCKDNNIPFHCFYWSDCNDRKRRKFSQEMARDWRKYKSTELLSEIMGSTDSRGLILTAHHKDDSIETVLLKMLRGVHLTNISGLKSVQQDSINDRIFIGKPMLHVGKKDIERFLKSQDIPWREDRSNQSSIYQRNRVRNELVPLLNELVGGEAILYSRLINAEEQSRKLREDITHRAESYLQSCMSDNYVLHYVLPQHSGPLTVVEEEALYRWVEIVSKRKISLPYDKLSMIGRQISQHPDRRQWKISVGNEWEVARDGDVLKLLNKLEFEQDQRLQMSHNGWTFDVVDTSQEKTQNSVKTHFISIAMKSTWQGKIPTISLRKVHGNESLKFVPYWRKEMSEIKIKEFLRGQKVPLHRRGEAPILCIKSDHSFQIIAVFVEGEGQNVEQSGRWVVHADFHVGSDSADELITIALKRLE